MNSFHDEYIQHYTKSLNDFSQIEKQGLEDLDGCETRRVFLTQQSQEPNMSGDCGGYLDALNKEVFSYRKGLKVKK